ncbi:hypothetical protein NEUTE1DRAFT_28465, partial [Neurospora tetrasperma FGSC 2508]
RKKLLVLKKTFKNLLNKGYIRTSNLEVRALVLFIYKLRGGLRFYYNYKVLNTITYIDCYPLLLICKTFRILKGMK